jgi:DNA-directed RNA polymerase specialized sigma24 family protein
MPQVVRITGTLADAISLDELTERNFRHDSEDGSGGFEVSDNGYAERQAMGAVLAADMLQCLTNRQREVVSLLSEGLSRKEAAEARGVSLRAVHQIIYRIRDRMQDRGVV